MRGVFVVDELSDTLDVSLAFDRSCSTALATVLPAELTKKRQAPLTILYLSFLRQQRGNVILIQGYERPRNYYA